MIDIELYEPISPPSSPQSTVSVTRNLGARVSCVQTTLYGTTTVPLRRSKLVYAYLYGQSTDRLRDDTLEGKSGRERCEGASFRSCGAAVAGSPAHVFNTVFYKRSSLPIKRPYSSKIKGGLRLTRAQIKPRAAVATRAAQHTAPLHSLGY